MFKMPIKRMMTLNASGTAYEVTLTLSGGKEIGPYPVGDWDEECIRLEPAFDDDHGPIMVRWDHIAAFEINLI